MPEHRLFVSQETLDKWMVEERVDVSGDVMTLVPEGKKFQLASAVHFTEEVAGGGDDAQLIGKVKDLEVLAELGGEHVSDSVILDESAYVVVEGFLGTPIQDASDGKPTGSSIDGAARAALGEPSEEDVDLLAQFFLG